MTKTSLSPSSIEKAAQATLIGDIFDDAATGQGLLNFFLRGWNCGAITQEELEATGVKLADVQGRSSASSPFLPVRHTCNLS